jgi:hypothetical protein
MRHVKRTSAALCLGLLVSAGPSFGAAAAEGGVEVVVLGQTCSQTVETEQPGNDLVETIVDLEIRNGTSAPIGVHRDRFRLTTPDGMAIRTSSWFAADSRSIDPGRAQTFELRFMSRGGLSCSKAMILESPAAVVKGTEAVELAAIRLVPGRRVSKERPRPAGGTRRPTPGRA